MTAAGIGPFDSESIEAAQRVILSWAHSGDAADVGSARPVLAAALSAADLAPVHRAAVLLGCFAIGASGDETRAEAGRVSDQLATLFPGEGKAEDDPGTPPLNSANFLTLIGPVKCPSCGWDDEGELRVVDAYDELYPSAVWPSSRTERLAVWGDDRRDHTLCGLSLCPVCDEDFSDPSTMERRET